MKFLMSIDYLSNLVGLKISSRRWGNGADVLSTAGRIIGMSGTKLSVIVTGDSAYVTKNITNK